MATPVLTLTTATPASDALARMSDAGVRHAVVLSGASVVGVVSDRDLGGSLGGAGRQGRSIADVLRGPPILGTPEMSVGDAANILLEQKIGCLPVVEGGELVGIVTRTDVLTALAYGRTARRSDPDTGEIPRPAVLASPNRDKWP